MTTNRLAKSTEPAFDRSKWSLKSTANTPTPR
jgi:hypothetical protein